VEHRVTLSGSTPVIAETRVWPTVTNESLGGGIDSDLLRRLTVRGAREAAARRLLAGSAVDGGLRLLESLSASAKRRGEARRWSLALTAYAYTRKVQEGSKHPNEDVAWALGVAVRTVRDRLYAARRTEPPILTGGGRQGVVGDPELTAAGLEVVEGRHRRVAAAMAMSPDEARWQLGYSGGLGGFDSLMTRLLAEAEQRIPGLWEMDLVEVERRATASPPPWVDGLKAGKSLTLTPEGITLVDRREPER
jgi:hypothetical protein